MTASDMLCKLNVLDSQSLDDVKFYMSPAILPDRTKNTNIEYDFFNYSKESVNVDKFIPFNYKINQYGFRNEDFPDNAEVGAFGCSFTFGQGLPFDLIWHQHIAKKIGKTVLNFGIPGASIQTICDVFCIVTKHIKLNKALILFPTYNRLQVANVKDNNLNLLTCIPNHKGVWNQSCDIDEEIFFKVIPDEEMIKNVKNSIYLIEHVAKVRNIKLAISSWDKQTYNLLKKMNFNYLQLMPEWMTTANMVGDKARDGSHPGLKHHDFFGLRFYPYAE